MLVLLPPSEGKTTPRRGRPLELGSLAHPELTGPRQQVLDALVHLCVTHPDAAMATLAIPKTQPELLALNASLPTAPAARTDGIYTGVLYEALHASTLSTAAKRRLASRVLITSSLFGVVGFSDHIPAYRLSGDTVLPGLGAVATHWRDHLGPSIESALGHGLLVDLRSSMYASFWRPGRELADRVASVRVLHQADGKRSVVSHFNKATKGRIVRALMEDGSSPKTPADLAELLTRLGWDVEVGAAGNRGTQLDVIVTAL